MSRSDRHEVGSELPLSSLDETGLAVLEDGTLVRIVEVSPLAPLRMSNERLERTSRAMGELASLLPDHQSLQLITNAEPLDTLPILRDLQERSQSAHQALAADGLPERGEALERLALVTAEGVVEHAEQLSAMQLQHLLVVPWRHRHGRRSDHLSPEAFERAVDDHDAHLAAILRHLHALGLAPRVLDGAQVFEALYRQLNPARALPDPLPELRGMQVDADAAWDHALDLKEGLCVTDVDDSPRTHLMLDETVPLQVRALSSVPDHTWLGWLMQMMQSPFPFTLSVRWEAGRRAAERQKAKNRYRRIWGVQRGREMRAKAPDPEAHQREEEAAQLNAELSATAGAGVYQVAVTLAIRNPGGTAAALERHTKELEREVLATTDARLHLPLFAQRRAWRATWPLGLEPLKIRRKYVTTNLADTTPLIAARCGSPSGIPLGWARPGRTLERLDPFDPTHNNHLMVIAANSGSGKTMLTNLILSRILSQGAHGGVIDRAGHYATLASLVPDAATVNLGTADGHAINPWDVDDVTDVPPEKLEFLLALHSFFLGGERADGTYDLDPRDHALLSLAIRAVYEQARILGEVPRETLLQLELKKRAQQEREDQNHELASRLSQLAEGLHDYVGDGAGAYLADRRTSVPEDSPLIIFDTRDVGDARAGAAMFTIVEHLARRSQRVRNQHAHRGPWGGRGFLVIDEGWKMLERRSTGRWINEQARRSRHNRLFLIAITQQLSDFTQHPEGAALVSQSSMQLFLSQVDEQAKIIQSTLGLTDQETETIAGLRTVKGEYAEAFLCNGRRGRGLIEVRAGAAEYWLATSEPDHDQPLRQEILNQVGGDPWAALDELSANHAPLSAR